MKIIGSKVYSKHTNVEGIITEIKRKKIKACFCYGGEVWVNIDDLIIDDELKNEILRSTSRKRTKPAD